ncbi:GntR family transcriptional regulator [Sporosarcina sp. P29]|uniref:GntR family transcriptional regulator n=1 Tax=Sporosarcina sp. P29 TaxID=2048252 RepID=UPI000C16DB86|nr:GntR family transcriptional regulator [Sporosarcina sp. P29]PIC99000.1 transcriptional regulator [Sporosarcina sp. P29]
MDELMEQIVSKTFTYGERLPSENILAKKHNVPRMTVRKALTKLEERGFIYSKQGKGRFLKEQAIQIQLSLTAGTSFTEKMKALGYELETRTIACEQITYDEHMFQALETRRTDDIYKIGRLRLIDGEPIAIHYSFVSAKTIPSITEDCFEIQSMFAYYRKLGYSQFDSRKSLLSITFPTAGEQQLLSCNSMVPLIMVESDCVDQKTAKVLEYTKVLYRSDKFKYDITMNS